VGGVAVRRVGLTLAAKQRWGVHCQYHSVGQGLGIRQRPGCPGWHSTQWAAHIGSPQSTPRLDMAQGSFTPDPQPLQGLGPPSYEPASGVPLDKGLPASAVSETEARNSSLAVPGPSELGVLASGTASEGGGELQGPGGPLRHTPGAPKGLPPLPRGSRPRAGRHGPRGEGGAL